MNRSNNNLSGLVVVAAALLGTEQMGRGAKRHRGKRPTFARMTSHDCSKNQDDGEDEC